MHECEWCKKLIVPNEPWLMVNVAPDAASGGVMKPFHSGCAPYTMVMLPNENRPPRAG